MHPTLAGNPHIIDLPSAERQHGHMELVRVPAGDKDARPEERRHRVYVSEFYIGKYHVTNAQYGAFAKARQTAFTVPSGKPDHPVADVSWDNAKAYSDWLSQEFS